NVGAGLGARHNWVYSILFNGDTMNLAGNFEVENVVHSPFARFVNGQFCYDPDTVLWQGYCLGMLNNQVYLGGQVLWSSPTVQSTALAAYLGGDCFSPTSVKGTQQTLEFQLVPNPSLSGRFIVKVNAPFAMKDASIKVVNLTGQLIYQEQYINLGGSFSKEINLGNVAKGLYFVEFVSGGERVVKKLVLE
ncbi:MAG: T9SS type A sorting domain-containing protein, partial [Chitinophagaceae bacterium]